MGARPAAQFPSGLTVDQAAAPRQTLIAVIVAVADGSVVITSLFVALRLSVPGGLGDDSANGRAANPRNGPEIRGRWRQARRSHVPHSRGW